MSSRVGIVYGARFSVGLLSAGSLRASVAQTGRRCIAQVGAGGRLRRLFHSLFARRICIQSVKLRGWQRPPEKRDPCRAVCIRMLRSGGPLASRLHCTAHRATGLTSCPFLLMDRLKLSYALFPSASKQLIAPEKFPIVSAVWTSSFWMNLKCYQWFE